MNQGVHPLTATLVNQLNQVEAVSNNLANANTNGYKEEKLTVGTFNYYLQSKTENKEPMLDTSVIMNTIPKNDTKFVNSSLGSIVPTGNDFDFALTDTNTFFKVQAPNGDVQLTRNGAFKVINDQLVDGSGLKILNDQDQPIYVTTDNWYAQIGLVKSDYVNVEKIGSNNYKIVDKNKIEAVANNTENLIQGSIEKSNVNQIQTMVALIDAQRKFEQAQKAITSIDDINKKVIDTVGKGQ